MERYGMPLKFEWKVGCGARASILAKRIMSKYGDDFEAKSSFGSMELDFSVIKSDRKRSVVMENDLFFVKLKWNLYIILEIPTLSASSNTVSLTPISFV